MNHSPEPAPVRVSPAQPRTALRRAAGTALLLTLTACALSLPACNIATPVFFAVHGPGKVQARYTLDPELKTVVFVDDPASKTATRTLRSDIASAASEALLRKGVVKTMIDSRGVMTAATKDRYGQPMSISELGRTVDADIVIYAAVTEFTLSPDNATYRPAAGLAVKVIDARSGQRLWPEDAGGSIVRLNPKFGVGDAPATRSEMARAQSALARQLGLALAQAFYKHEVTESASR
jgi:hypothetical protein